MFIVTQHRSIIFKVFLTAFQRRAVEYSTKELFNSFWMAVPEEVVTIAVFIGAANSAPDREL